MAPTPPAATRHRGRRDRRCARLPATPSPIGAAWEDDPEGATSLRYTTVAADDGASITLRETAYGTGGSTSADSGAIVVASTAYDPSQEPGLLIDLWADRAASVHELGTGIAAWEDGRSLLDFAAAADSQRPSLIEWRNGRQAADFGGAGVDNIVAFREARALLPVGGSVTAYLFGELDSLNGVNPDNSVIDFEWGRLWLLLEVLTTTHMGWFDTSYKSTGQASVGAHVWTWALEHGANGECFEDGVSLGTQPFTGNGLGGTIRVGSTWSGPGQLFDGKKGRLLVFGALHDAATRARVEQWGRDYYALP